MRGKFTTYFLHIKQKGCNFVANITRNGKKDERFR